MEPEKITEKLIQFIEHALPADEMKKTEAWIDSEPEIKYQYQQLKSINKSLDNSEINIPSDRMTARFVNWLDTQTLEEKHILKKRNLLWKIAAGVALLVVSGAVSWSVYSFVRQQNELDLVKAQLEETKRLVMTDIQNPLSASSRITAVHHSEEILQPDDEIIQVLTRTLNEDPSSNVRMAALDALSKFYLQPGVRTALIQSMEFQKDAVVQIALIQLLVQMKEKSIVPELQKLIDEPELMKAVKDEAYRGIFKLT